MAENKKIYSIAVIGGGAAGAMSVSYAVNNHDDVLFIPGNSKNKKRSRAFWVSKIENMPGLLSYSKAIEQPNREMIKEIEDGQLGNYLTHLKNTGIVSLTKNQAGHFQLKDNKGVIHYAKFVVLATGLMDIQPEINGDISPIFPFANVQLVDYCLRCDGHHSLGKKTTVIGNGNGAAWIAVMLFERYQQPKMTILTNGEKSQFSKELQELINLYSIEVNEQKIIDVVGNAKEKKLEGYKFEDGTFCESEFTLVSLGSILYNELAQEVGADIDGRGYVSANEKGQTSVEGLFVAGDLRAGTKNQVYTAWDCAVESVIEINRLLRLEKRANLQKA